MANLAGEVGLENASEDSVFSAAHGNFSFTISPVLSLA